MKKIFFFVFFFYLSSSLPVLAQTCSPVGVNIAANFDRENLEFIRNQANCTGQIPITVILTPELNQNHEKLLEVQQNLKELNFNPTWRPWGEINPQSKTELEAWIDTFSLLEIGQLQTWNEWNRYTEITTIDPGRDAQVVQALLKARNAGQINIPIGNTPLDLHNLTDMSYRDYWTEFNNVCPSCLNRLDFIVSNVYTSGRYSENSVSDFLSVWQGELNFLKNIGVNLSNKYFVISEAGLNPGAYVGNFNQRLEDTLKFASDLEREVLNNPQAFPGLDQITFLLMNDETGKQYLIYRSCDKAGNCSWLVRDFLVYNQNVSGREKTSLTCTPQKGGDLSSWPVECDTCNQTDLFTPSCATSFTVSDTVSYNRGDGTTEPPHCVEREWGGTVTIDPTHTTIPFVGKKKGESEQIYLADYFEGTNEYYQNYEKYWLDWVNHAGVFRKLSPMQYQDKLKKEMIRRAQETLSQNIHEGGIHDYKLSYRGRVCWDLPLLPQVFLTFVDKAKILEELANNPLSLFLSFDKTKKALDFILKRSHYCFFDGDIFEDLMAETIELAIRDFNKYSPIDIRLRTSESFEGTLSSIASHLPPSQNEKDYFQKWQNWQKLEGGKWFSLWQTTPMFSREDTPGKITPYLGARSKDETLPSLSSQIEKVPHVARLYELTQELNKFLLPAGSKKWLVQEEKKPIIAAAASSQVLGEKKLLAQAQNEWDFCDPTGNACFNMSIRSICCSAGSGTVIIDANGYGHVTVAVNGAMVGFNRLGHGLTYNFSCPSKPGETFSVSVTATNYDVGGYSVTGGCSVKLDQNASACCAGGQPPTIPLVCGITNPSPVYSCSYPAITDSDPNDSLCCSPIAFTLNAVDAFENPEYDACKAEGLKCEWICPENLQELPLTEELCWRCHNPCDEEITKDVSREFGISLSHPYLSAIWDQTGNSKGLFNIFRPAEMNNFREVAGKSQIGYSYCKKQIFGICLEPGSVSPETGDFYFPYLGGVQMAKNWTVRTLFPSAVSTPFLPPAGPITLDYVIDYRNPNISISQEVKADVISRVKKSWPRTQIEEKWDLVHQEAVSHGFNPAFVIALWIEESGASGVKNTWDLGCGFGEQNNLSDQLNCLFNRFSWSTKENVSFEEFMCYYGPGHYPCEFSSHPNFPRNIKFWYDLLTRSSL